MTKREWQILKDDYNSSYWAKTYAAAAEASDSDDDDEAEHKSLCTKPIAVEAIIGHTEYKFLPDRAVHSCVQRHRHIR